MRCSNSQLSLAVAAGVQELQHHTNTHSSCLSVCPGCIQSFPLQQDSSSICTSSTILQFSCLSYECNLLRTITVPPPSRSIQTKRLVLLYSICSKGMVFLSLVLKAFMLLSNTSTSRFLLHRINS